MSRSVRVRLAPLITEFVGTFLFCLIFTFVLGQANACTAATESCITPPVDLIIGIAMTVVVYIGGFISGGHFNPAVTLAVSLTSYPFFQDRSVRFQPMDVPLYWIAQVCGSLLASVVGKSQPGVDAGFPRSSPAATGTSAFLVELLGSMSICLVVLNVSCCNLKTPNVASSTFGLAIGFTVTAWEVAGRAISGGAFNPAVGCLALLQNSNNSSDDIWLYWAGPFSGSFAAVLIFWLTNPEVCIVLKCCGIPYAALVCL